MVTSLELCIQVASFSGLDPFSRSLESAENMGHCVTICEYESAGCLLHLFLKTRA